MLPVCDNKIFDSTRINIHAALMYNNPDPYSIDIDVDKVIRDYVDILTNDNSVIKSFDSFTFLPNSNDTAILRGYDEPQPPVDKPEETSELHDKLFGDEEY